MASIKIAIIEGTVRKGRQSIKVGKLIEKVSRDVEGVETVLVDPLDFQFPFDGNEEYAKDPKYTEITETSDAFFIVVPEYNHSFPGSLKRMLDSELGNYIHKPVTFASVSAGPWGGVRAVEALLGPVREMGMVATFSNLNFPNVGELFDEDGELTDEKYIDRIKNSFEELIWMTKCMQYGIENLANEYH
jgi:NAD(P)H-dependent FMN reductase